MHSGGLTTTQTLEELQERKKILREQAHAARRAQDDKDALSRAICAAVQALPEYQAAQTVMWYVDVRTEVRTRHDLPGALAGEKRIVVPWCKDGELELFELRSMEELETGAFKILEPASQLRDDPARRVTAEELDFIMVPGVAFDRRGGRMGHGFGYYDKLLEHARADAPLVALAFECQLFDEVPMQSHDVFMDCVVTESGVYPGVGRG